MRLIFARGITDSDSPTPRKPPVPFGLFTSNPLEASGQISKERLDRP
jgi:hypothetical protein